MPTLVTEWCEIFGTEIYTVLGHISLIWSPLAAVNRALQCRSINFTNELRLCSKHLFHVQMIKTKIWGQAVISFCLNSVTPDLSLTTCDCMLMKKSLSLPYCQQSCPPSPPPHHTSCCHCNLHITSTSQQCVNEERDPKLWFKIFLIYKKYFNFGFLVHESPETAPLIIQCSSLLSVSKWKVQSSGLCLLSTTQRKGYFNAPKAVKIKPWSYRCLCSRQKEQGHEWPKPRAKSNSFPQRCPVGGNNNNNKKRVQGEPKLQLKRVQSLR